MLRERLPRDRFRPKAENPNPRPKKILSDCAMDTGRGAAWNAGTRLGTPLFRVFFFLGGAGFLLVYCFAEEFLAEESDYQIHTKIMCRRLRKNNCVQSIIVTTYEPVCLTAMCVYSSLCASKNDAITCRLTLNVV